MAERAGRLETHTDRARHIARRFFKYENAVLVVVLIVLIASLSVITKGLTSTPQNMRNILIQSSMRGVSAVGQAFVILTAGIDLSVGGIGLFVSVLGAAMVTGLGYQNITGGQATLPMAIATMLVVAIGIGAMNGTAVSRVGVPPLIVTLAMWEGMKGIAFLTGKGQSIGHMPEALSFIGSGNIAGVPVPIIIFIAVSVVAYFVLTYTEFGRSVYAAGGNPASAWLSGINVKGILFRVYIISAFLAGLAGVIATARIMSASMATLSGLELDSIASVVIGGVSLMGGRGNLIGVVLGVIIIGVINNGMSVLGANPAVQGIARALIIFSAVAIDCVRRRR